MSDTTECQLLELAAKAAGIKALRDPHGAWRDCTNCVPLMNIFSAPTWNPLISDGDALRLAAEVRLVVKPGKHPGDGCSVESQQAGITSCTVFRDDPAEQMRRAIVMVAAEIGKAML